MGSRIGLALVCLAVAACSSSGSSGTSTTVASSPPATTTAPPTTPVEPSPAPTTAPSTPVTSTTATVAADAPVQAAEVAFSLPEGFPYPEGAAWDPSSGRVYVTSYTSGAVAVAEPGATTASVWLPAGSKEREVTQYLPAGTDPVTLGIEFGNGSIWVVSPPAVFEYSTDGTLLGRHLAITVPGAGLLNDVAVTAQGVYLTDSWKPVLWYLPFDTAADAPLQPIDLGALGPEVGADGFNGIEALPDGTLVVGQFAGGLLFHVDPRVPSAATIDVGGHQFPVSDGMTLLGDDLWVARGVGSNSVDRVRLCPSYDCGTVVAGDPDPNLAVPSDVQVVDGAVLVVNSQLDRGVIADKGAPSLPFTVASIALTATAPKATTTTSAARSVRFETTDRQVTPVAFKDPRFTASGIQADVSGDAVGSLTSAYTTLAGTTLGLAWFEGSLADCGTGGVAIRTGMRPDATTGWEIVPGLGVGDLAKATGSGQAAPPTFTGTVLCDGKADPAAFSTTLLEPVPEAGTKAGVPTHGWPTVTDHDVAPHPTQTQAPRLTISEAVYDIWTTARLILTQRDDAPTPVRNTSLGMMYYADVCGRQGLARVMLDDMLLPAFRGGWDIPASLNDGRHGGGRFDATHDAGAVVCP